MTPTKSKKGASTVIQTSFSFERPESVVVRPIPKSDAKSLIEKFHYLGPKGFRFEEGYGLFVGGALLGAAVYHGPSAPETVVGAFGLPRTEQAGIWELGRLVLDATMNGKNYGSMLIGRSVRLLRQKRKVRALITYAEGTRHYGAVYQATNFIYCGTTKPKKDFYLLDGTKQERGSTKGKDGVWKDRPLKHRYVMVYDKTLVLRWEQRPYVKAANDNNQQTEALTPVGAESAGQPTNTEDPISV